MCLAIVYCTCIKVSLSLCNVPQLTTVTPWPNILKPQRASRNSFDWSLLTWILLFTSKYLLANFIVIWAKWTLNSWFSILWRDRFEWTSVPGILDTFKQHWLKTEEF
jgi:hypothetical protein